MTSSMVAAAVDAPAKASLLLASFGTGAEAAPGEATEHIGAPETAEAYYLRSQVAATAQDKLRLLDVALARNPAHAAAMAAREGRTTAAETTGPARGPRPASSMPAISLQPFAAASFSKTLKSFIGFQMTSGFNYTDVS